MTVGELKAKLAEHNLSDDTEIQIAVTAQTDKYPKAYVPARFYYYTIDPGTGALRIEAPLPQGMTTRKAKVETA